MVHGPGVPLELENNIYRHYYRDTLPVALAAASVTSLTTRNAGTHTRTQVIKGTELPRLQIKGIGGNELELPMACGTSTDIRLT